MLLLAATLFFVPHYEVTRTPDIAGAWGNVALTTDTNGNAYVVTAPQNTQFLSKFDPDGNLIYRVTPMPGFVQFQGISVDSAGNVYAALIVNTAVVAKIDPSGNVLFTYRLPVAGIDAIAVGADGSIYVAGAAYPQELQTTPGAWISSAQAAPGSTNAYVIRVSPAGQILYATFLDSSPQSANPYSDGTAIAVDGAGNAYIGGTTTDPGFPTTSGAYQTQCCSSDPLSAFLVKLNPAGSAVLYSTFLPGEMPTSIIADAAGNASLTVSGSAGAAIVTAQFSSANAISALVTTSLAFLSPPPGNGQIPATADGHGNILVTGELAPANLAASNGALQNGANFAAIVRAADGALLFATRLPNGAGGIAIAPDGSGGFVVIGTDNGFTDGRTLTMLTRFVPAAGPQPGVVGVTNVAGDAVSEGLAPGEKVAIYGTGLGPQEGMSGTFVDGQLPLSLGGTEVFVNGTRAPILYASYDQVNAIVPFEVAGSRAVNLQLQVNGQWSNTAALPELAADPDIYATLSTGGTNAGSAVALNQDQSLNSQQHPAQLGSIVTIWVNGAGLLTPAAADGTRAPFGLNPVLPVTVQVAFTGLPPWYYDWTNCELLYAGSAPEEAAGMVQIDFRIPAAPGPPEFSAMPIQVTVGNQTTRSNIWIPSS